MARNLLWLPFWWLCIYWRYRCSCQVYCYCLPWYWQPCRDVISSESLSLQWVSICLAGVCDGRGVVGGDRPQCHHSRGHADPRHGLQQGTARRIISALVCKTQNLPYLSAKKSAVFDNCPVFSNLFIMFTKARNLNLTRKRVKDFFFFWKKNPENRR